VQNINHLRALEGELARTIRTIDRIAFARVHLVIPERQLFQRDRNETTASIVLKVRGSLEASQVRAIQYLVASAVDGLKPERVSIVDERGELLASGEGGDESNVMAGTLAERKVAYETRLQRDVGAIVSSVVPAAPASRSRPTLITIDHQDRRQPTRDAGRPFRPAPSGRIELIHRARRRGERR
jgi:flagellar M-ring protein FliF